MPFSEEIVDQYVLFNYVNEMPVSEQQELARHTDRMEDDDGYPDALIAIGILAVGPDSELDDDRLNRAETKRLKRIVNRAYRS